LRVLDSIFLLCGAAEKSWPESPYCLRF